MQCKSSNIWGSYNNFFESGLVKRRFGYDEFLPVVRRHNTRFKEHLEGLSVAGRAIYSYTIGNGRTPVLLWSQMHGNEPVSTLALLDVMNFLETVTALPMLKYLTVCALPMLNPDGNENFCRRNAFGIDLNRDAVALAAPESRILKNIHSDISPLFGFNIHDQEQYYTTLPERKQTMISFLAPKFNADGDVNETRKASMQLIASAVDYIRPYAQDCIGKYSDSFMPNAFGDNMMLWGTSTILVECGASGDDIDRRLPRKAAAVSVIKMLKSIASKDYTDIDITQYDSIPNNIRDNTFDLKISGIAVCMPDGGTFRADMGIRRYKGGDVEDFADFSNVYRVEGFGDLSQYGGIKVFDGAESAVRLGKAIKIGDEADYTILLNNGTEVSINQLF
ncbi:MAG: hypothetical protein IKS00_03235 [Bacteroidales bacterium]|nr:hypothetical protein [Bacteroidales bacterium]